MGPGEESPQDSIRLEGLPAGLLQLGLADSTGALLAALAQRAPIGVFANDAEGACVYVNAQACTLLGLTPEEALGSGWAQALHPDDAERMLAGWWSALAARRDHTALYRFRRPDGGISWVEGFVSGIWEDSRLAGWIGLLVDVTAHKEAEEELRRAKEYAEQLIETSNALVLVLDPEGNVQTFNRAGEQITGYTREELVGRSWTRVVPRERVPETWEVLRTLVESGIPVVNRSVIVTKSGEERRILWQNSRWFEAGQVAGTVSFGIDVTELEAATQAAERGVELLRIADDERRRLLKKLVHAQDEERQRVAREIHDDPVQVLTAVVLRIGMLLEEVDDPELQGKLSEVEATSQAAVESLRHLVFELHPPILARDGLAAALELELSQIRNTTGIKTELASSLSATPSAETAAIAYRIAQEALLNVRKHAGAQRVEVSLEETPDGLLVRIADDGCGFSGKPLDPGHLGLVSMRERAEMAGGWWRIKSEVGQGTTVAFLLPPWPPPAGSEGADGAWPEPRDAPGSAPADQIL